ncbi:hypothetical protein [Streptomyces sp. UNOB3_S3]|uniref:hypothetical protein n=1 Tax=Streptomyces sp. UNOB3_S3 TaxID=2871682 RepID=UPI001E4F0290|nr:hypothetical protein [Streptomyces sp. UNOB3_S3]MCC3778877.1 hypothetical protein [Streptomyces sp. UNOB3_S3]
MKTSKFRALALTASAASLCAIGLLGSTPAAAAGELQVTVHTNYADRILVSGINQYGTFVSTDWIDTPNTWTRVYNWWWQYKSDVTIVAEGRYHGRDLHQTSSCRIQGGGTPRFADCYAL